MLTPNKPATIFDFEDFSFGRKFALLSKLYVTLLAHNLRHLGIERQFSVLVLLNKMDSKCSQKIIGDMLHIDKTMMVGVIDRLSKKGLIKRTVNPEDRREYWIQLTKKGKDSMPEVLLMVRRLNKSIMKGISPEEVKKLHTQLELIYQNLQDISKQIPA